MDSYQDFLKRFKHSVSLQDYETLTNILKDSQSSLIIIPTKHLESFVNSIFDRSDGLLFFLNSNTGHVNIANKHYDDALVQGFHLLKFLIENFYKTRCFKHYIDQIKDVCQLALYIRCIYFIQKAAYDAFIKLIELFGNQDLEFVKTVKQFVEKFPLIKKNERKLIFCVIGKIIKQNGGVGLSQGYLNTIFKLLYADLKQEYNPTSIPQHFYMYFDALSDILDNIEPPNDIKEGFFLDLYKWIKYLADSNEKQKNIVKSAMEFLNRHMNRFQNFVYLDYADWYRILRSLSCKKTIGTCGQCVLKTFYRVIAEVLKNQNNEQSRNIFLYFLDKFSNEFKNTDLDLTILRLTVYGFSQMAVPCKMYLPSYNIRHMYSIIVSCSLPLCSSKRNGSADIENICCYQEALSEMLYHMPEITIGKINILMKLNINIIKRFPILAISSNHAFATLSLIKTICNLGSINKNLLQRYLDNIIYDGIAWSCSHTLALDAELQRELNNLQQSPICYKNYLPLWTQLLNIEKYHAREYLTRQVADTLMNICVTLINRLDIRVKRQYESSALSDVTFTRSAVNQADFRVFTNLVDLYVDIMNASDPFLYVDSMHTFLHEIVRLSYKHPLISGFYKLVRAALKIFHCFMQQEEEKKQEEECELQIKKLLSSYLANTLNLIPTFSNELLIACLYLILDEPGITYVTSTVSSTHVFLAFKIAFTVGLSNLELAYTALTALEIWVNTRELQERERTGRMSEMLHEIVPHLEPYLHSMESVAEISQDLMTTTTAKRVTRVKRVGLIDTECTLRNFQRRVMLFLGSLDHDILSSLVHERSLNTGASWDQKNLLKYILSLPDVRLTIHFDPILPRVITLARSSSDRRTRIAACEVLHSMIALIIGSTTRNLLNSENPFATFYTVLCPTLLALGSDSDEVVRNLFQQFTLQLMHWLSSPQLIRLSAAVLLDSLFDGLCDDANPSLREFAGMCLAEFTSWSIRQMSDERETQLNVHKIICKIDYFALHPSARKRVAAAVAFNHLYTILREDDEIVSTYWLQMFYCFIYSMNGCDDPAITNALDHIEKVIKFKAYMLNVTTEDRKKPQEFDGKTLTHALYWLLSQCGIIEEHCRTKCMELYVNVSQYAIDGSAKEITRTFVETYGIDRLNDIILKGLRSTVKNMSATDIMNLLKALDYYTWLIEKQLLPMTVLFPVCNNASEHMIFTCIYNFVQFWRIDIEEHVITVTTRELEELQTLRCKTLMAILNFVQILLINEVNILPESLWEWLLPLTIKCLMHPQAVGFDVKNIEMMEKIPHVLETLLNAMKLRFNDILLKNFQKYLLDSLQIYVPQLVNLHDIARNDLCNELIQHVNGLITLERCGMLNWSVSEMNPLANHVEMIKNIFNFLVSERIGELTCSNLSAQMIEYLQSLMKLQLLRHETLTTETLMRLICNDTPVIGTDSAKIALGEQFLNMFHDTIFEYILRDINTIVHIIDKLSHDNPAFLLKWSEDLILHLKQHKHQLQEYVDDIVDVILRRFTCLANAVGNNTNNYMERLINIYGIAVRLKSKPIEITQIYNDLYVWILQQLTSSSDIEYKTQILQNFFVCLTDAEDKPELVVLRTLKSDGRLLCPRLSNEKSVSAMKVINCFETLLTLLSVTRSIAMLDCVIHFAAGAGDRLLDDKLQEHLRRYYCGETLNNPVHVLRSLEMTYRMFMNNADINERLDILRGFLLPAFEFCDTSTIERFFEHNIRDLHTISRQCIVPDDDTNFKQIIVSKIGCYQLIAIMFARVEEHKIIDANGIIVQNAGLDYIKTGRELLQNLFHSAKNIRALKITRSNCRELVHRLHCSAYNCTLAILSLKKEERYYCWAFEDQKSDLLIWKNIVDCHKYYQLGQIPNIREDSEYQNITVNMRSIDDVTKANQGERRYSYIYSYDLTASTLNEDINAYDLNKCILLPSFTVTSSENMMMALESDDFNQHECMPYICGMLLRLSNLEKEGISAPMESECPKWLQFFLHGMLKYKEFNIRLFLLKIFTNTADIVFKPYARFVLPSIAQAIVSYLEKYNLNYIITDVLEILIDWPLNDIENIGRSKVQMLVEVLIDKMIEGPKNDGDVMNVHKKEDEKKIYNYNLDFLGTIMVKWRSYLVAPVAFVNAKMTSAPEAAIYLIQMLLNDVNMAREIINRNDIIDFLLKSVELKKNSGVPDEEMLLRCCKCLGSYVKLLEQENGTGGDEETARKRHELKDKIFAILTSPQPYKYIIKQMKCICNFCKICPDLAANYINVVIDITSANRQVKSYCLEIFALSIPQLDAEHVENNLRRTEVQDVLKNRLSSCDKIALQIVHGAVTSSISPSVLVPYVNSIVRYVKHDSTEYRELAYNVFMSIYKKYSADISDDDNDVMTLLSTSVENLLIALLDPSHELQTRVLQFWTEETGLSTNNSKERLIAVLDIHTSRIPEDAYALFVPLLMLRLANRSVDYTRKMFEALHNCAYEDYRIAVSWRRRNLSYVTPMFVDSLAAQMSCTFSQSINDRGIDDTMSSYHDPSRDVPKLRATQNLQFEPTAHDERTDMDTTFDHATLFNIEFNRSTIPTKQPALRTRKFRSRKLLRTSADTTNTIRQQQIQKRIQRAEIIKQENIRQRNSVRLYRNYRIGDFPDIEIPHSSLIEPLQQLIKLDRLICKDVTVSLICSLIKEITDTDKSDDFLRIIVNCLKKILQNNKKDSSFNAAILEIFLTLNITDCDPQDIVRVSKANGLNTLGVLLLERSLLPNARDDSLPTSSKRMKKDKSDIDEEKTDKWTQLAFLYKSLDDVDNVLNIFRKQFFSEDVQKAAIAGANGDWLHAKTAFERAYKTEKMSLMQEHCLQGLFEAMNNLCDWSAIDELVKSRVSSDLNKIWNDKWHDWMIPYACDAYIQMLGNGKEWKTRSEDLLAIQSRVCNPEHLEHIKPLVGEDLVMLLLKAQGGTQSEASNLLNDLLDRTGEQWTRLSPLCTELTMHKLQKLRAMSDLNASLKVFQYNDTTDYLNKMTGLLEFWSAKAPTIQDNLVEWNKLAAYRTYFLVLFGKIFDTMKIDDIESYEGRNAVTKRDQMLRIGFQLRLSIVDIALKQKHRYITEKHLSYMSDWLDYCPINLKPRLMLLKAKAVRLNADLETDARKKMQDYAVSWKYSHELLNEMSDDNLDISISVRLHIGTLASTIERLSRENKEFAAALFCKNNDDKILQDVGAAEQSNDPDSVRERLLSYSLDKLKSCWDSAEMASSASHNIGRTYCILAKYYYGWLTSGETKAEVESDEIFQGFVYTILQAMYYGYQEAMQYFPCLLRVERLLRNETTRRIFEQGCAKLRPWMFLYWRDLLFSRLGTPITSVITPLIKRLTETYPDAVAYTYHLAVERNPAILCNDEMQRIRMLLHDKAYETERFLMAIQYMAQPELFLKYYLNEVMKDLSKGKATTPELLLRKVYPSILDQTAAGNKDPRPGDVYKKVMASCESAIRALNPENPDATRESIRRIKELLDKSLLTRKSNRKLKDYSPFLHEYVDGNIEIPGQYKGDQEPMPQYHVKIARIEPIVQVMRSLRKPIRINMIGDNGREYKFLVKFGEDLTIDHGLQQLYTTMNRTLRNDTGCRQRRLTIDTYEVIPLSKSFGLIQWIENTRSLEDLVRFTLSKSEWDRCEGILREYAMWIANAAPSSKRIGDQYKEAMSKYSQMEVRAKMRHFINETKQNALRETFVMISPSPESFVTLRHNFITSYATMCAAHWISGVGDRHLQNTLVVVGSGRCLGIDFGHAFDIGVRALIPELIPFRLTPQILELLRPFTERDLLGTIMTHAMRAFREYKGPIFACMDIFVHKPVNRSSSDDETEQNNDEGTTRPFKKNLEIVVKKLSGTHPSSIILEQLKEVHNVEHFTKYQTIVTGNDVIKERRSIMKTNYLTPGEQVDCLLDQATDLNILGRMYANWQPWL